MRVPPPPPPPRIRTSIAKIPITLCFVREGGSRPPVPLLDPRMSFVSGKESHIQNVFDKKLPPEEIQGTVILSLKTNEVPTGALEHNTLSKGHKLNID